jgi:Histidine kinase-, DNA gyrase B-, and HSP90-like ATPase
LTYRHFPYKAWNAVGELVDNSTQSYFENRRALDRRLKKDSTNFAVRIDYSRDELFSIYDNAMGMDLEDLTRAVQLAAPPPVTSGRSEFGMGMKTG